MSDKEKSEKILPKLKPKYEYYTIEKIIDKFESGESLDKINLYGVISFIKPPSSNTNCTTFILVDNTSTNNLEHIKLKANDFTGIEKFCEIGDIVRLHRLEVQSYKNSPQGLVTKICSLIRFKLNDTDFSYKANRTPISAIKFDDSDKAKINELREWAKSKKIESEYLRIEMNQNSSSNRLSGNHDAKVLSNYQSSFPILNPIKISQINQNSFFDVILQVCAICSDCNGTKFLMVWDGTKSNLVMHQRNVSSFVSRISSSTSALTVNENKIYIR